MRKLTNAEIVKLSPVKRRVYLKRWRKEELKKAIVLVPVYSTWSGVTYLISSMRLKALQAAFEKQLDECHRLQDYLDTLYE